MGNVANPRVWLGAEVFVAPVGTTAPTDVSTALNVAFKSLGLLSEDGPEDDYEQDSTDLFAQGPDSVLFVRTVTSKHKPTIKVVAVEDNKTVRALRFPGSSASFTSGVTTTNKKAPTSDQRAFVIEQHDGTTIRRRVIPRGEVVERTTLQDAPDDMAGVEFVIAEYFDASGVYEIELSNDAQQDPT